MALTDDAAEVQAQAQPLAAPSAEDDPLYGQLAQAKKDLDAVQAALLERMRQLRDLEGDVASKQQTLGQLTRQRQAATLEGQKLEQALSGKAPAGLPPDLDELRRRSQDLVKAIKDLEHAPLAKQVLRYPVPVSRTVEAEELFLECKAGRVTFIDLPAFTREMEARQEELDQVLKSQWQAEGTTAPVGAFRLHFVRERFPAQGETPGGKPRGQFFRSAYSGWELEPLEAKRGESAEQALQAGSTFRQLVDGLDPNQTVVTFWVYPDSFASYRQLRDYLQQREVEVAGRPLPMGQPIRASRYGSKSRGQ
jgi:hypothetical protein